MGIELKREYLKIIQLRYQNSKKFEKTKILDEFCLNTGCNRKYAIRLLRVGHKKTRKRPGRKKVYSISCVEHLRKLWKLMDYMCSKKMVVAIPLWIKFYPYPIDVVVKEELLKISASTIDRELRTYKVLHHRKNITGTTPPVKYFQTIVPIKSFDYNVNGPGVIEADTVAHCGGSLLGQFVWSLTFTDVYSGWTENRAVWSKKADGVVAAIKDIEENLFFPIEAFNVDNGSEFLNNALVGYFSCYDDKTKRRIHFTRSRAYKKNDNCHVEQKNWTHVRETFGYERFDEKDIISIMNNIYINYLSVLKNFFVPQLKLLHKTRIGSKYKRVYSKPMTPYQRIMECEKVSQKVKDKLTQKLDTLNPFELNNKIEANMKLLVAILNRNKESTSKSAPLTLANGTNAQR